MDDLRAACARVAERARQVTIEHDAIPAYAASLPPSSPTAPPPPPEGSPEQRAAFWLTLDAINFGSGWFPTLRKRGSLSGYNTIAAAWRERRTPVAEELAGIDAATVAAMLGQDPGHELMALYAASLRDLAEHVIAEHGGSFLALGRSSAGGAAPLARRLAGWACFADVSRYDELSVPFRKRAQIAAADLARAGVIEAPDAAQLTIFADNLVPHVLRLDGVLRFDAELVDRIERAELIAHGSREEVEIRACAVHATELIVAAGGATTAMTIDELLWSRGQEPAYKAVPRHRSRCTAY